MLDSQFRGTSQQLVLHFNEEFRRVDELNDLTEKMPESIKLTLLQNAVKVVPQLSIVETLDEYTSTTSGAGACTHLTYTSYYNILMNACVRNDATNTSTPSKRRNVYAADAAHAHNSIAQPHGAQFSPDIDTTRSIPIYSTMLHRQNEPSMVHLWIGVPMVDFQVLM